MLLARASEFASSARDGRTTKRLTLVVNSTKGRFKYLDLVVLGRPERLALDLWKSAPPPLGSVQRRRGFKACPSVFHYTVNRARVTASGRVGRLFEGTFRVRLRDASGEQVAERFITTEPGAWSVAFRYEATWRQRGTLQVVNTSAIDGTLNCIVQVGVLLGRR